MRASTQSIITYLQNQIALQRDTLFLWIPVFVGLGIFIYFGLRPDISIITLSILSFSGAALTYIVWRLYHHEATNGLLALFYLCLAGNLVIGGVTISKIRDDMVDTPLLTKDTFIEFEATIQKLSAMQGETAKRVYLSDIKLLEDKDIELDTVRLKTYHFKGNSWRTGDRIRITAKLFAPSPPVMPDGFDFRFKARFDGISATGFTIKDAVLIEAAPSGLSIQNVRDAIGGRVYQIMEPPIAALSNALLTGERAGITDDDAEAMRASGLAHILAISGLHIGLVAGCMFFFSRLALSVIPGMALRYPIKKWAAIAAITVAFAYMILAGATVPTVRAFIMTSLVLTAIILDRSAVNLRLVAIAALFVMLTTPEAILGPSFQLSFAAVTALIAFYQGIGRRWFMNARAFHPAWRPIYYLAGIIGTTIIATIATAPFSIYFFNRFAAFSVLSNILAMPVMSILVMPFGLLSVLAMPLGLDAHIWPVMAYGVDVIITIARAIASYQYANIYLPTPDIVQMGLIGFGFIWLLLWQGHLRWIGAFMMCVILLVSATEHKHHILVSEDGRGVMMIDTKADKVQMMGKASRYVREQWLSSAGMDPKRTVDSFSSCDDFMCRIGNQDTTIAIVKNKIGLAAACQNSDFIIADFPIDEWDECIGAKAVIDRFDVWRDGATMIEFDNDGYTIKKSKINSK